MVRAKWNVAVALLFGLGLLGAGAFAVNAAPELIGVATPAASSPISAVSVGQQCQDDEGEDGDDTGTGTDDADEEGDVDQTDDPENGNEVEDNDTGTAEDADEEGDVDQTDDPENGAEDADEQGDNHTGDACEDGEAEVAVPAGTIDDGEEFLSKASITVDDAVAKSQDAASGKVGEVDLEDYNGTLVFNVDIGDSDVKVDAATGEILSTDQDD